MKNDNRTVIWLKRLCFYTIFKMEMVLFKTSEHFMEMFPKRPELKLAILGDTSSMDGTTTIQKGPLNLPHGNLNGKTLAFSSISAVSL